MKKLLLLSTALFGLTMSFATTSSTVKPALKASEVFIPIGKTGQLVSLMELSQMSVKDLRAMTGKKMSLADRISFKAAQRQLKQSINYDGTIDTERMMKYLSKGKGSDGASGFHLGGFALGFFLWIIGVLIAYLIEDDKQKNRVKWAWIGFAVSFLITLPFWI